jgi:hypothetical protein
MARRKAGSGSAEDKALSELYLGDFEAFTARRNELAKQMRARGDSEGAERVRKLKKPSRVAWAINQLSGQESAVRDELLGAGAALRKAHERLLAGKAKSADLREASEQEQAAVTKALDAVTALSESAGTRLSPPAADRARQTLHAVSLDDDVRRDFERQRLTTEHEPSGLGAFSVDSAASSPKGGGKTRPAKDTVRRESKRRRDELKAAEAKARKLGERERTAELEVDEARQAAERAQRHLERATRAHEKAASDATAARRRVDELRERSD